MRFWVADDIRGCGRQVADAAIKRGHEQSKLLKSLDYNVAYVRTINYGPSKLMTLNALEALENVGIPFIPGRGSSYLYDNKLNQIPALKEWLPETWVFKDMGEAYSFAANDAKLPIISKSSFGSASSCVRLLSDANELRREAHEALAPLNKGIRTPKGYQKGYVIWQRFIPRNPGDVRICVTGDRTYGLYRKNRRELPFASGSGILSPIVETAGLDESLAFQTASEISNKLEFPWACYDFVFEESKCYCLEISFSWTERAYNDCPVFHRGSLEPTGEYAHRWPEFAVDLMESLAQ